jgi:aminoglycoside 6-adenylyltransferase
MILRTEGEVLTQFDEWARGDNLVRAAILTSSRADPEAKTDFLSDYDIELYVSDIEPFQQNDDWLTAFDDKWLTRLVLFKDGVRIDFQITDQTTIEADAYDNGYRVLLDKDCLTLGLHEPTFSKYIIKKPSREEYETLVHDFWWDAIYVPKCLWRDELPFAKYMLDNVLRYSFLQRIVEWYIGLRNDWSVNTGICGKRFKRYLDAETWLEFESTFAGSDLEENESTFAGSDLEENWQAFFNTINVFRRLAKQIGTGLGYDYPEQLDEEVMQYCLSIRKKNVE